MRLLLIDNYDSFTYNLVQLVEQAGVDDLLLVKNDQLDQLVTGDFDKVLISPGPGIASGAGQLMDFLHRFYSEKDILGICLGFEALGELFGAKLSLLSEPLHGIKNEGHRLLEDPIFNQLPEKFTIGHYHSWKLEPDSFPEVLEIMMQDEDALIMAFRHKNLPLRGLQFHPESIMTEHGLQIIKNWLSV